MNRMNVFTSLAVALLTLVTVGGCRHTENPTEPDSGGSGKEKVEKWSIHDGKFWQDGKWVFIKAAKPLTNYGTKEGCEQVTMALYHLQKKNYNAIEINCYWHHFDMDGDGTIDVSLAPLKKLIETIYARGMYPCLSVETYAVGGGNIPEPFWDKYPDAYAVDSNGIKAVDDEYGFGSKVVSIFHEGYREAVHKYIKNLVSGLPYEKILYYETTVEPQYMGNRYLCYSESARKEYNKWRQENNITDAASEMPEGFPMPESFVKNETWNKFRAQFLAKWVNDDAAAFRSVAGENAYIAVDYLDGSEASMMARDGNPEEFLRSLTSPNIIQVNWHFNHEEKKTNQKAYDRVWKIIRETGRDWAVTEHMTFNGNNYSILSDEVLDSILQSTLDHGTRFGWEFTNSMNQTADDFCLYNDNWTPKRVIARVDNNWDYWQRQIQN
ncbi:MAG: hypothetical protein K6A64_09740 [Bacteroidales bacterium]|nr:hypothetical protein [Bacteroidales bacterium]